MQHIINTKHLASIFTHGNSSSSVFTASHALCFFLQNATCICLVFLHSYPAPLVLVSDPSCQSSYKNPSHPSCPSLPDSPFLVGCFHHDSLVHVTSNMNPMAQVVMFPVICTVNLNCPKDKIGRKQGLLSVSSMLVSISRLFLCLTSHIIFLLPTTKPCSAHIPLFQLILSFFN